MQSQRGFVLISVLFILAVLYLLLTSLLEIGLLETKMSSYYQQQIINFYETEQKLSEDEASILSGTIPRSSVLIAPSPNSKICGIDYYRVTVTHSHGSNSTSLESTFAKIGDLSKCDPKPTIKEGRQSFRVTETQ